jgi:uncharacterized membrane protein
LQAGTINALLAIRNENRTELRLAIEQVRQALRDMLDERPVWRSGTKDAALWLGSVGLSTVDLAEVFSVSPRRFVVGRARTTCGVRRASEHTRSWWWRRS